VSVGAALAGGGGACPDNKGLPGVPNLPTADAGADAGAVPVTSAKTDSPGFNKLFGSTA
jgi:hypothetical protein